MARNKTIRFAVGQPNEAFSGMWRLIISKNEVYIGASGNSMSSFKISLHNSGIWVLAATKQSGGTFENENRRAKQWKCPVEHVKGVTRGPSILVPRTTLGSRTLSEKEKHKKAIWYAAPKDGELVEFSVYFVEPDINANWNDKTIISEGAMKNGTNVVLLGSTVPSPPDFLATCEKLLRENVFRTKNPDGIIEGSFLWITESPGQLSIPLFVDLPVPIKHTEE